jgi:8-oxo-dGTP pyrophosphatase MutT (NUDIX family)
MHITQEELVQAFNQSPPGNQVQYVLAPVGRPIESDVKDAHEASVMCMFYFFNAKWHIVFIERTSHNARDKHKGQISFPGGKIDPEDVDRAACALRELEEEIGVQKQDVKIIREMTPLYIPVSNFKVFPFVGICTKNQTFKIQESEVERIHIFSLAELLFLPNIQQTFVSTNSGKESYEVPAYKLDQATIWGATAMILHEILYMVRNYLDL